MKAPRPPLTALGAALDARIAELGTTRAAASRAAGLSATFVRDVCEGRSADPGAAKLSRLAVVLGMDPRELLRLSGAGDGTEVVSDPGELALLRTWRHLRQDDREAVLDFIRGRTAVRRLEALKVEM